MLMVIFGAGASYDSDARNTPGGVPTVDAVRLPLAKGLVDRRFLHIATEYRGALTVLDYIQQHTSDDSADSIETILAQYAVRAEGSAACRQALLAFRFYLCRVIGTMSEAWLKQTHGLTTYLSLLGYLMEWQEESGERVQLVTFNYDTLLEHAASQVLPDWNFDSLGSYVARSDWGLLKLHGSVSWSRMFENATRPGELNFRRAMAAASEAAAPDLPIQLLDAASMSGGIAAPSVFVPAIAVPMTGKTAFECDPLHVEAFRSAILEVERLLICGWRAAETHALEMLRELRPGYLLGIVSDAAGLEDVGNNLGDVGRKGQLVVCEDEGMSAFAQDMRTKLGPLLREL